MYLISQEVQSFSSYCKFDNHYHHHHRLCDKPSCNWCSVCHKNRNIICSIFEITPKK